MDKKVHSINQHQNSRLTFGAQKLFGITRWLFRTWPFIPLHFLLAQSPAGHRAINQIFHLKFKDDESAKCKSVIPGVRD